jgi:hypothetical protein
MASPIFAGLTILMLGDSHFASTGYLINTLADELMRQGAKVTTYAACGAPTSIWVDGGAPPCGAAERVMSGPVKTTPAGKGNVPSLNAMVSSIHPNLIIIGAGDTMAGYAQPTLPTSYINQQVGALTRQISALNIPCVWIGPGWGTEGGPYFKTFARAHEMSDYLANHVAPCRYIDSLQFAKPGEWQTFDGQHYNAAGYQKWGQALDQALVRMAQTPP